MDLNKEKKEILFVWNKICVSITNVSLIAESMLEKDFLYKVNNYLKNEKSLEKKHLFLNKTFLIYIERYNKELSSSSHYIIRSLLKNKKELYPFFKKNEDVLLKYVSTIRGNQESIDFDTIEPYNKILVSALEKIDHLDLKIKHIENSYLINTLLVSKIGKKVKNKIKKEDKLWLYDLVNDKTKNALDQKEKFEIKNIFLYLNGCLLLLLLSPFIPIIYIQIKIKELSREAEDNFNEKSDLDCYNYLLNVDNSKYEELKNLLCFRMQSPSSFDKKGRLIEAEIFEITYKY